MCFQANQKELLKSLMSVSIFQRQQFSKIQVCLKVIPLPPAPCAGYVALSKSLVVCGPRLFVWAIGIRR